MVRVHSRLPNRTARKSNEIKDLRAFSFLAPEDGFCALWGLSLHFGNLGLRLAQRLFGFLMLRKQTDAHV